MIRDEEAMPFRTSGNEVVISSKFGARVFPDDIRSATVYAHGLVIAIRIQNAKESVSDLDLGLS